MAARSRTACAARLLPLLLLLTLPAVVQAQYTCTTNADGTIIITRYTGSGGAVVIPSTITGRPVVNIGPGAFDGCASLASVTIPNSVIILDVQAFCGCNSLTNVSIPNSVTYIGDYAFLGCTSLPSVSIPKSVNSIGEYAFTVCPSLTAITVNTKNLTYCSVAGVLFNKSTNTLIQYPGGKAGSGYTIPNSVTNIGDEAFEFCVNLTSVTIPTNVTSIGDQAFVDCFNLGAITVDTNNLVYSSVAGVLFNKSTNTLIQYPGGKAGSYTIPASVTSIGDSAFEGCVSLTSVTIPKNVTKIENDAFYWCTSLTGVYFQGNAPSLGDSAVFYGDDNATAYYLSGTTGWAKFSVNTGLPTVLWNPQPQNPGVRTNQFGFTITGSSNLVIVVAACTNFAKPVWQPVSTNTLNIFIGTNGTSYFSDSKWTNYPGRFYRLRSP